MEVNVGDKFQLENFRLTEVNKSEIPSSTLDLIVKNCTLDKLFMFTVSNFKVACQDTYMYTSGLTPPPPFFFIFRKKKNPYKKKKKIICIF